MKQRIGILFLLSLFFFLFSFQRLCAQDTWHLAENEDGKSGYLDSKNNVKIPYGTYDFCFTDIFKTIAFVYHKDSGMVAIDKSGKILLHVFQYDNGPDYVSEGLFRIVKDGKKGYADETGKIVIVPVYDNAFPFSGGKAKVSVGNTEFYINKKGKKLKQ